MEDIHIQTTLYTFAFIGFIRTCLDLGLLLCVNNEIDEDNEYNNIQTDIENMKEMLAEIKNKLFEQSEIDVCSEEVDQEQGPPSENEEVEQYQLLPPNHIEEPRELQSEQKPDQVQEDKHDVLRRLLKDGSEVYCSYKATTFVGTFHLKPTAPHGYVIRDVQNNEFATPTDFSFTKKRLINPKIHSDNGWDSIYIHKGANKKGVPKKLSLKNLVEPL